MARVKRGITDAYQTWTVCANILVWLFLPLMTSCSGGVSAQTKASYPSYIKGEKEYKDAIVAAEQSGSDWEIVMKLNQMAEFYRASGRYKEAEPFYLQAKNRAETKGPRSELAKSLSGLGIVCAETSRYSDAETFYQQAIQINESIARGVESENPALATDLNNLAELYRIQGRYGEAEPLYERARGIWQRAGNSENVAITLNNQAYQCVDQRRYEEAEGLFQTSIKQFEGTPKARPEYVASSYKGLATLLAIQKKYAEAEPLVEKAITLLEKAPNDAITWRGPVLLVSCLVDLGNVQLAQGHNAEAKLSYQRAVVIGERTWGTQHPMVIEIRNGLGKVP